MAFAACFFGLLAIPIGHLDRLMKIASGKCIGMKQAIDSFAFQFGKSRSRIGVAIVALCVCVVGRIDPGVIVLLHDVAIRTGQRIVAEIGSAFGVVKSKCPSAQCTADGDAGHNYCDVVVPKTCWRCSSGCAHFTLGPNC